MNDTVPNFPPPGNEVSRRVSIWPRRDMLHCVPMLLGKDMLHPVSILPGKDASHRVPILSGREVFYRVPIFINRRKRKNRIETPTLRLAGTPTPRHALSTLHALHRVPIVHRPISESIA